jgi:hypothetical protein
VGSESKDFLLIFAASKEKAVKRGVKEVVKAIRKGEKGYTHTIPILTHMRSVYA